MTDKTFTVTYDSRADVLYITAGRGPSAKGKEDRTGIVWKYDAAGHLIAAVIMDFRERWTDDRAPLARELSEHFRISTPHARKVIDHALAQ